MSTFPGPVKELVNISIDKFNGPNMESSCFFLSHCHTDHMKGLDDIAFSKMMRDNENFKIYCSKISKQIIKNYCFPLEQVVEISDTTIVEVPSANGFPSYKVTVTPIPAGHCPGSVMFLFETHQERILYTGDFRIGIGDVKKLKVFKNGNTVKKIDKIYFDATFFNPIYFEFPSRSESLEELIEKIENWFKKSTENDIRLVPRAWYGYENLFIELSNWFQCLIYVKKDVCEKFQNVPEIGAVLTDDPLKARIRVFLEEDFSSSKTLNIRTSAMWFNSKGNFTDGSSKNFTRVCYATHCSYSELLDFLSYLQPTDLEKCTKISQLTEEEAEKTIQKLKNSWTVTPKQITIEKYVPISFEKERKPVGPNFKNYSENSDDDSIFD